MKSLLLILFTLSLSVFGSAENDPPANDTNTQDHCSNYNTPKQCGEYCNDCGTIKELKAPDEDCTSEEIEKEKEKAEKQRQTNRQTHRERQRDRRRHRQTNRHTGIHTDSQRETESRHRHRQTNRHTDTQTHKHTDRQTDTERRGGSAPRGRVSPP